jgi:anti-anti-sigma factor
MQQKVRPSLAPFTITVDEIDAATADQFRAQLATALDDHLAAVHGEAEQPLVIDLRSSSFMDSTGIRALVDLHAVASAHGVRVGLLADRGPVRRTLEVTGVWERLAAEVVS